MAWEYLLTNKLDARVLLVAGYLADKIEGKVIVDLDCMHAPILKYLPRTYKVFHGNDILSLFPEPPELYKAKFYTMKDEEFTELELHTDILIVFGMGGYEQSKEELESKTLNQSILKIVDRDMPEIVVIESVQQFSPIQENFEAILKAKGYNVAHKVKVETEDHWLQKRLVTIYTR